MLFLQIDNPELLRILINILLVIILVWLMRCERDLARIDRKLSEHISWHKGRASK